MGENQAFKNWKSLRLENITNETMKCSDKIIIKYFQTLFNNIMEFGYYSDSYDQGLMFSIYKSGKNGNQNNYRCTTLSKCPGKLFNTILYNKLQKRHSKSTYLSPAQVGF